MCILCVNAHRSDGSGLTFINMCIGATIQHANCQIGTNCLCFGDMTCRTYDEAACRVRDVICLEYNHYAHPYMQTLKIHAFTLHIA